MKRVSPCRLNEWQFRDPLPADLYATLRRKMMLDHFKWDPQVGDVETLARFPIVLPAGVVSDLATMAESLAAETTTAENELLGRPGLLRRLGLPRLVRRVLADDSTLPTPAAARVIRFDFHPTTEGWRISEANSDVPGGYTEASHFPRLMAEHWPDCHVVGDPLTALIEAICSNLGGPGRIGFLAAPGFIEDQQVVACLADAFGRRGWTTIVGRLGQLVWNTGNADLKARMDNCRLDAVVRFFQGEWLSRIASTYWTPLFRGGRTPVCNPGIALLTESKRFPLIWDELKTPLPTWRTLLPETRDPRAMPWRDDGRWLLKPAYGNNGDDVIDRRFSTCRSWRNTKIAIRFRPGSWLAQQRFDALPISTPDGLRYPCMGVYTVNGRYAGIYGRIAATPFIDYSAVDVAVLMRGDSEGSA